MANQSKKNDQKIGAESDPETGENQTRLSQVEQREKDLAEGRQRVDAQTNPSTEMPNPRHLVEPAVGVLNPNPALRVPELPIDANPWSDVQQDEEPISNPHSDANDDALLSVQNQQMREQTVNTNESSE